VFVVNRALGAQLRQLVKQRRSQRVKGDPVLMNSRGAVLSCPSASPTDTQTRSAHSIRPARHPAHAPPHGRGSAHREWGRSASCRDCSATLGGSPIVTSERSRPRTLENHRHRSVPHGTQIHQRPIWTNRYTLASGPNPNGLRTDNAGSTVPAPMAPPPEQLSAAPDEMAAHRMQPWRRAPICIVRRPANLSLSKRH